MTINFRKLSGKQAPADLTDPLKLFESLDRKGSHTHLRPAQIKALEQLHGRRKEQDIVLKMPTGTGKSVVGLLYLKSLMGEKKQPGVYLCPTTQLVQQVLEEAQRLGIPAHHYASKQPHPHVQCTAGEAITVCTYDKLFNGITTFNRTDVHMTPVGIVLDDAHAGVEEVRDAFSLQCANPTLLAAIMKIISPVCRKYAEGIWEDIQTAKPHAMLAIPYWKWGGLIAEVRRLLSEHCNDDSVKWAWPHLKDILRWCRCIVSARGIEILPDVLPVWRVRPYSSAAHRLFMSATLADDSVLVRELACDAKAAGTPIVTGSDADVGERMVLVPSLLSKDLDREWVMRWCKTVKRTRIVVLCPSEKAARTWEAYGATAAIDADVPKAVNELRAGRASFIAFAQRYDGVDLPDDSCRILIIDGMPYGESIADQYDGQRPGHVGGARNRIIYRIEQGMGRAVRSPADYAVVILAGPELANFTAKIEVRDRMNPDTRAQIELASYLADLAQSEGHDPEKTFQDLVKQCLQRDADWKEYYDGKVRQAMRGGGGRTGERPLTLADAERQAAMCAIDGDPKAAADLISEAITKYFQSNESGKATFIQLQANYLHEVDPAKAVELQKSAFGKDKTLFRPPAGVVARPTRGDLIESPARVLKHYATFANGNGMIAGLDSLKNDLAFGVDPKRFEQALQDLSPLIGVDGSRPEQEEGEGPDNLWIWPALSLVIEAKNDGKYGAIPKRDAEQLLHSMEWFKHNYGARVATPVIVAPVTKAEKGVFLPEGTRVITPDTLDKLVRAVDQFTAALAEKPRDAWNEKAVLELQTKFSLTATQFVGTYTIGAR